MEAPGGNGHSRESRRCRDVHNSDRESKPSQIGSRHVKQELGHQFTEDDEHAVTALAAVAWLAVDRNRLETLATLVLVTPVAGLVSRGTPLREDASFAAFYLTSLAAGVLIVSMRGSNVDLMHILFGTVLALDDAALYLIASIATVSLLAMAAIYRGLVAAARHAVRIRCLSARAAAWLRSIKSRNKAAPMPISDAA